MKSEPAVRRVQVRFTGRVQGVGFRFRVVELASQRPVTGFVMNYPDGSVVMVAEGDEAEIHGFLQDIQDSSLGRFIREMNALWQDARHQFDDFRIRDFGP